LISELILQMNKKDYPLKVLKDAENLLKEFKKLVFQNSDIVEQVKSSELILHLQDIEHAPFVFLIREIGQDKHAQTTFTYEYAPAIRTNLNRSQNIGVIPEVFQSFNLWIDLLRDYNDSNLGQDEEFTKRYEKEIYQEFDIIDEDAYFVPFEPERQRFFYYFLTGVLDELKAQEQSDEVKNIILETEDLQNNIQNLTKKNFIKGLAKIGAKLKKRGIRLFIEIFSEAKKELIKRALTVSYDQLGHIISSFLNLPN